MSNFDTSESGKVFEFRKQQTGGEGATATSSNHEAQIVRILHPKFGDITRNLEKRHYKKRYPVEEFFKILFSSGKVKISTIAGSIKEESILTVTDNNNQEFSLPLDYFVYLTISNPESQVLDYEDYLVPSLTELGINISLSETDDSITHNYLEDVELDDYHPEAIRAYLDEHTYYACEVYHEKQKPIGSAEIESFKKKGLSLLDLMLHSLEDSELNGFDIQGAHLTVIYFEKNAIVETTIFGGRLEYIIMEALKRINPIYQNMSFDHAREYYYKKAIIPKLNEKYIESEND